MSLSVFSFFLNFIVVLSLVSAGMMFMPAGCMRSHLLLRTCVMATISLVFLILHAAAFLNGRWVPSPLQNILYGMYHVLAFLWLVALYKAEPVRYVWSFCCAMLLRHGYSRLAWMFIVVGGFSGQDYLELFIRMSFVPFYLLAYVLVGRKMRRDKEYRPDKNYTLMLVVLTALVLPAALVEDVLAWNDMRMYALFCINEALYCLVSIVFYYWLYKENLRMADLKMQNVLLTERNLQLNNFRSVMDIMNIRIHDLKHQVYRLVHTVADEDAALAELNQTIDEFQSFYQTGNTALDVILTEKALRCMENGIVMECGIGNGGDFSFLSIGDIYALFGNALDNAMEYLQGVEDEEKRFLRIRSFRQGDMCKLSVENYFEGEISWDEDGCPKTTKADSSSHGFGTRSIQNIARKYGGNVVFKAENGVFRLQVLFGV